MRRLLATCLAGALAAAVAGCGSGEPPPRHGILFGHAGKLYLWRGRHGLRLRRLIGSTAAWYGEPAWSPDGQQIAFTQTCTGDVQCQQAGALVVASSDGGRRRTFPLLLPTDEPSSWSPDGRRIAFAYEDNPTDVGLLKPGIVSVASGNVDRPGIAGARPAWGTPGIAYLHARRARWNPNAKRHAIRLLDPATGRWKPLASPPPRYSVQAIAWSPQGRLAAVEARLGERHTPARRIVIYTASGRVVSRFDVPDTWRACGVTWSPDGSRLLLTGYRAGFDFVHHSAAYEAYTVDPGGKDWHRLPLGAPHPAPTSCNVGWR